MTRKNLVRALIDRGLVADVGGATQMIEANLVLVNGSIASNPQRQVSAGDEVVIRREDRFVSRGGEKLDHALTTWRIDVAGLTVVDLGSSTGGFTDCLLQRGVKRVVAVDVGEHLLHEKIVADQRVEILAGVNVRDTHLLPARVADLVVVDLSFISVIAAIPAIQRVAVSGAMAIVLVKPQFEASRAEADRFKGVIEDPAIHERVLTEVEAAFGRVGCVARDRIESPVRGAKGNREFLLLLEIGSPFRGKD
jgi:23S rRNA (cytidine1920-2'-O)/16S rRNA (cytidine1409-2'-O)-methyltransferase